MYHAKAIVEMADWEEDSGPCDLLLMSDPARAIM